MSDAPISSDQVDSLLWGAETAVGAGDNDRAWALATEARGASGASSEQQARAAVVLARAALGFGAPDLAHQQLADAEQLGAPSDALASVRGDLRRYQRGADAAGDGVQGAEETAAVIASAREAIGRGQHEQAEQLLRGIWDTTRSDEAQLAEASYQMGRALLGQSRATEAKEYADWAAQQKHPEAAALQAEIAEILGGYKAAADGVQVAEQRGVFGAAQAAYNAGDHAGALDLYLAVYESPALAPRQKGGCAFNIAQCHRFLGSYEMASSWFEEYLRLSPDSEYAAEVATNLDRMEELAHLTAAIPLE